MLLQGMGAIAVDAEPVKRRHPMGGEVTVAAAASIHIAQLVANFVRQCHGMIEQGRDAGILLERWPVERAVETAVRRALGTLDSAASLGVRFWPMPGGIADGASAPVDVEVLRPAAPDGSPLFDDSGSQEEGVAAEMPLVVPPLLQLRKTWMMFEREDGVVLIDQHSAHERILFEEFMRSLETGKAPSQRLLFPLTLHLGPAEGEAFDASRELFERLGFEIEGFGGHTLILRSVPMPHPRFEPERCLRETLDALTGDRLAGSSPRHEKLAATVACKAAIKAGDNLSQAEMRALFLSLSRTILPAHDVHGRSTIVHLSWDELERRFGRR